MATAAKQTETEKRIPELHECDWATPEIIAGIEQGIKEVDLIKAGKMKPVTTEEIQENIKKALGL